MKSLHKLWYAVLCLKEVIKLSKFYGDIKASGVKLVSNSQRFKVNASMSHEDE